ncbi:MAG: alkaline phosphatase [Sandaracinaceae bacterium]
MRAALRSLARVAFAFALASCDGTEVSDAGTDAGPPPLEAGEGAWASEVSASSAVLSARITAGPLSTRGERSGAAGVGRFEVLSPITLETEWRAADEANDYIVRARVDGLPADAEVRYRFVAGRSEADAAPIAEGGFRTLPGPTSEAPVRVAVLSCMHLDRFLASERGSGPDGALGYPGFEAIGALSPQLLVVGGDAVYYDQGANATRQDELRRQWHRMRALPRTVSLLGSLATFWMKDDHDYRYDEADPFGDRPPSAELGRSTWYEQTGLSAPGELDPLPYRTIRLGALAELWLLEGRELRDPNDASDDENKSLWGDEQRAWLQRTLLESTAPFRIVISPTPLVGPDDLRKHDNHTNVGGFRTEGRAFLAWAMAEGLPDEGFLVIAGDRHWQYHSIDPSGVEELAVGAFVEGNARLGVAPGDPEGTDPDAAIVQPYTSPSPQGGFLWLSVDREGGDAVLRAELRGEDSEVRYAIERRRTL